MALARAPGVVVSPIAALYPLGAMLFTHLFLKRLERVTFRIVCGASLIVLGVSWWSVAAPHDGRAQSRGLLENDGIRPASLSSLSDFS